MAKRRIPHVAICTAVLSLALASLEIGAAARGAEPGLIDSDNVESGDIGSDEVVADPEAGAILASHGAVVREGGLLRISTDGGIVTLVDDPDEASETYTIHRYEGRIGTTPFLGVHLSWFESAGYLLVHADTGRRIAVDARPLAAPSGERLAVASFDLEATMLPNVLVVYAVSGDSLRVEWREEPLDWGPQELAWVDDATLTYTRVEATERGPGEYDRVPTRLVRRAEEWAQEPADRP